MPKVGIIHLPLDKTCYPYSKHIYSFAMSQTWRWLCSLLSLCSPLICEVCDCFYSTLYAIWGEYQIQSVCLSVCVTFQRILSANRSPMLRNLSSWNLVCSTIVPTPQSSKKLVTLGQRSRSLWQKMYLKVMKFFRMVLELWFHSHYNHKWNLRH